MNVRTSLMVFAATLAMVSCGGGGGYGGTPTTPTSTGGGGTTTTTTVTITILGERGALSFNPNPATVPAGQMVIWKNADTIVHRVVIGVVDTGDIAPGASSAPLPLGDVSKSYHCSIHPGMVGSLNGAAMPDPGDCDGYGC